MRWSAALLAAVLLSACGSAANAVSTVAPRSVADTTRDACALVTSGQVQSAVGYGVSVGSASQTAAPGGGPEPTCLFHTAGSPSALSITLISAASYAAADHSTTSAEAQPLSLGGATGSFIVSGRNYAVVYATRGGAHLQVIVPQGVGDNGQAEQRLAEAALSALA